MGGMKQGPSPTNLTHKPKPGAEDLRLLVTWPSPHRAFLVNLRDLVWRPRLKPLDLTSAPGEFWSDVLVRSRLPWGSLMESAVYHLLAAGLVWSSASFWPQRPQVAAAPVFHSSDVIYYQADELPPLDTGTTDAPRPQKGAPELAAQQIISVPPEADNFRQTIVTPPKLKLSQDVPLPNLVAWADNRPTLPPPATLGLGSNIKLPVLSTAVIAPAPEVSRKTFDSTASFAQAAVAPAPELNAVSSRNAARAPQAAIVEPPPQIDPSSARHLGDINIGHAQVVAPAPQLALEEARAVPNLDGSADTSAVPPPPSVQGEGNGGADSRLISLAIHPVNPSGPVDVPAGNRRGTFAATPAGKPGAAGTPDIPGNAAAEHSSNQNAGAPGSSHRDGDLPPGLHVRSTSKEESSAVGGSYRESAAHSPATISPSLLARATPARVTVSGAAELPVNAQTEMERKVFAGKKSYAMTLNTPNLNSAGGSWVIHFAELKGKTEADGKNANEELLAPVATQEVDPGYPIQLMRENVQGTVTLSAVIEIDGSVGSVQVLSGVDDRLDQYACAALARWRFQPATRNGSPVALQAVVRIPFKPGPRKGGF